MAHDGIKGFTTGWFPTLAGYSVQGMGKFGFYEIFKNMYAKALGDNAKKYQVIGWAVSAACAEVFADIGLCPFEALKVKMQTSEEGTFPKRSLPGF